MTQMMTDTKGGHDGVELACRAPSLHNSQPWRWVASSASVDLFVDPRRTVISTDSQAGKRSSAVAPRSITFGSRWPPLVGTRTSNSLTTNYPGSPGNSKRLICVRCVSLPHLVLHISPPTTTPKLSVPPPRTRTGSPQKNLRESTHSTKENR